MKNRKLPEQKVLVFVGRICGKKMGTIGGGLLNSLIKTGNQLVISGLTH